MTTLNDDGLIIKNQDLGAVSPGPGDDARLYNHDGSSSITLTNGNTTTERGYYMWDNASSAWKPMKISGQDKKYVNVSGDTMSGNLGLGDNILNDVKSVSFTDQDGGTGQYVVSEDSTSGKLRVLDPTGNEVIRWVDGGNVEIPNGNLTLQPNGDLSFDTRRLSEGSSGTQFSIFATNGGESRFYDLDNNQTILTSKVGGDVEIPNGRLIASGRIETGSDILASSGNNPSIETAGGGSNRWNVYDAANSQHIAVFKEGGNVDVPNGSLTQGSNPSETITETTSPTSFNFSGSEKRDIHTKTDVSISNGSTASATEDVTVELYDGVDTTGTLLLSEVQSVTVAAGGSKTVAFINQEESLDTGTYHIEITTSGTTLAVGQADEYTKGATYTLGQTATGDFYIQNQDGERVLETDSITGDLDVHGNDIWGIETLHSSPEGNDVWFMEDGSGGTNTSPFTFRFDDRDWRLYGGTGVGDVFRASQDGNIEIPNGQLNVNRHGSSTSFSSGRVANFRASDKSGNAWVEIHSDDGSQSGILLGNPVDGYQGRIHYDDSSGKLELFSGKTVGIAIQSNGDTDFLNRNVQQLDQVFVNEAPDTTFNLNNGSWNVIPWGTPNIADPAYTWENSNDRVKFSESGTYKVEVNIAHTSDGSTRQNYHLQIEHYDGTWSDVGSRGLSGYMRDTEGHDHSSCHAQAIIEASAGDYVKVKSHQEADTGGSVTPMGNSTFQIEKLHR